MGFLLYGARGSGSGVVEAALAELGLPYEVYDLDVRNQEQRGEAYAAINPARKMPALVCEDGEILTESVAIVVSLAERYPEGGLLPPAGSKERARALRWILYMVTEMYSLVELVDSPERFVEAGEAAKALHDRAMERWWERMALVEAQASGSPYFLESGFSAVDLFLAIFTRWDSTEEWRKEHIPKLERSWQAVRVRPALRPVWARHVPGSV